jgi:hypothetical protein
MLNTVTIVCDYEQSRINKTNTNQDDNGRNISTNSSNT